MILPVNAVSKMLTCMTQNNHIHGGYSIVLIVFICVNFLSYKFKFQSLCSRNAYCKNANFVSTKPIVLTPSCNNVTHVCGLSTHPNATLMSSLIIYNLVMCNFAIICRWRWVVVPMHSFQSRNASRPSRICLLLRGNKL